MTLTHTIIDSPLGELTLVSHDGALSGVYYPGHWYLPDPATFGVRAESGFEDVEEQLGEYFAGERTAFELPTSTAGDAFQERVWELIARIPYGETTTYGELARELGDPAIARAVGGAVGRNPLSIVVPCHRVVGKDGKLTGYAGGLERKRLLLDLEAPTGIRVGTAARLF
jgi:methylated-DNA-[protein]-cysteine S-methyltransferase